MAGTRQQTTRYVNVHMVRGSKEAIDYLLNTDAHVVEGLFWMAKRYGKTDFEYQGSVYELVKNRDLTFTIELKDSEDVRFLEQFRG
jgi:hypothetical protein